MKRGLISFFSICALICISLGTSTAEPLRPSMCKEKALAAATLLEKEGESAFETIKDENGEFRFGDGQGYVWIQNVSGLMLMHPIKPALDNKDLSEMQDMNGLYLFIAFAEMTEENGQGWVPYVWPKPGEEAVSPKISYVVLARHENKSYIVGSGMYDIIASDIKESFPDDPIYEF